MHLDDLVVLHSKCLLCPRLVVLHGQVRRLRLQRQTLLVRCPFKFQNLCVHLLIGKHLLLLQFLIDLQNEHGFLLRSRIIHHFLFCLSFLLDHRRPLLQLLIQIRSIGPLLVLNCIWIRHVRRCQLWWWWDHHSLWRSICHRGSIRGGGSVSHRSCHGTCWHPDRHR